MNWLVDFFLVGWLFIRLVGLFSMQIQFTMCSLGVIECYQGDNKKIIINLQSMFEFKLANIKEL